MASILNVFASDLADLDETSSSMLVTPAATSAGGYLVSSPELSGSIETFTLGYDLYVGSNTEGTWNGLFQTDLTNQSDGDLFLHTTDSGDFGIGISGQYEGAVPYDTWARVVFTVEANGDGTSTLLKYIDGALVGTQSVETARFTIDGDNGFLILADENGETLPTHLGAFAFLPDVVDEAELAGRGGVDREGFGVPAGLPGAFEFSFENGELVATTGLATMTPRSVDEAGTVTTSDAAGVPAENQKVLAFQAAGPEGGFSVTPHLDADATTFSLVYDILVPAENGGYGGLFQTDTGNGDDGELFLRADDAGGYGIGISGQYEGSVAADTWARLVFTVADNGDGTSRLAKYIDGTLVGEQTVDTARFTVGADTGFSILTDNDHETYSGYLANFAFGETALSEADVAALGGANAAPVPASAFGDAPHAVFNFSDATNGDSIEAVSGHGTMTDLDVDFGPPAVEVDQAINHHLITVGETLSIDLSNVFSGEGLSFAVIAEDGAAIDYSLDGNVLTIEGAGLGFRDFTVTATDGDGESASDNFRVRAAGENAYTIAVLPDTQDYSWISNDSPIAHMTQWLADNKDSLGLTAALHVGDVTGSNSVYEWGNISAAYEALEQAGIPYTLLPGNHDQATGGSARDHTTNQDVYFGAERYFAQDAGGVYDGDTSTANNYKTFTAPDGTDWIVLSLEFGARDDVIRWGNEVLTEYSDHRAIVMTHHYTNMGTIAGPSSGALYAEGTGKNYGMQSSDEAVNDGIDMWNDLVSKHANVSFVFSGHVFGDGAETIIQVGEQGNAVAQMLVNYQNGVSSEAQTAGGEAATGGGGNGAMRLLTIDPENDAVYTETYYTELDTYMTGSRGDPEPSRDGTIPADDGADVQPVEFGSVADLGFPAIDGDGDVRMMATPHYEQSGLWVDPGYAPENGGDTYLAYTLVFDMYVPQEIGLWSILSTDTSNQSDGDLWIQGNGEGQGLIGLSGQDDGPFDLDGWRRIVVTYEATDEFGSSYKLNKYVDGVLMGSQILSGSSKIVSKDGFVIFGDDGGESPSGSGLASFAMVGEALSETQVAALGGVTADGPFSTLPEGVEGTQWTFENGDLAPAFGNGIMSQTPPATGDTTGITGAYLEHQETIRGLGITTPDVQFNAVAGDDQQVVIDGDTAVTLDGSGSVDPLDEVASAVWSNADGEVVATGLTAEIAAEGGANRYTLTLTDADGIVSTDSVLVVGEDARQLVFDGFDEGDIDGWTVVSGNFMGAGAANSGAGTAEGHLQVQSDTAAGLVLYTADAASAGWDDYTVSARIENESDQAMGLVAGANGDGDGYRLSFDVGNARISLLKVVDGEETVLAVQTDCPPFDQAFLAELSIDDGTLMAAIDGVVLFGGAVTDPGEALTGTVGVFTEGAYRADIDYINVRQGSLIADAGAGQRVLDTDGDGVVAVSFSGEGETVWSTGGETLGEGDITVDLSVGDHLVRVDQTVDGETGSDTTLVEVVAQEDILLVEDFEDAAEGWRFVDEGELGDAADWAIEDGRLVQSGDVYSRQLMGSGDTAPNITWQLDWSPLGDGYHALRQGTYALYVGEGAAEWRDYSIAFDFDAPSGGAVGVLFHYVDEDNYYKLELDKAGGTSQLVAHVDGIDQIVWQAAPDYDVTGTNRLRLDIEDGMISASVDGIALFAPFGLTDIEAGTFGLYNWGAPGTSYDNLEVVALGTEAAGGGEGDGETPGEGGGETPGDGDGETPGEGGGETPGEGDGENPGEGDGENPGDGDGENPGEGDGETPSPIVVGTDRPDTLQGTGGADTLVGGAGADLLVGAGGDDVLFGDRGNDTLLGGHGDDSLFGGARHDVLRGGDGDDHLDGGRGADLVLGGRGDDLASGGAGHDTVRGGAGDDTLMGGAGHDTVRGGDGDDRMDGGAGHDALFGGAGADIVYAGAGHDRVRGGEGNDVLLGGAGDDTIRGDHGDDRISGGAGADMLFGGAGDDVLFGDAGDDIVLGKAGHDTLFGGAGADTLRGGAGENVLTGGEGGDRFVVGPDAELDTITDFSGHAGEGDVLVLRGFAIDGFADLEAGMEQVGSNVEIDLAAFGRTQGHVVLEDVMLNDLSASDFLF